MTISRYKPFLDAFASPAPSGFEAMINQLLSEPASGHRWMPAVDIRETENALVVKADLPEVDEKDIDIQIENGTLTLKGERKFEKDETGKGGYHRIERSYGTFARSFTLSDTIDAEKVAAEFKNGVLTITLPKKEAAKPRTIKVAVQ
ncbi:MAG TPA: Hsp20/alpha crystallin family protein [Bryobacteraceae bacterium]|jgi:HSP20 family protein